MYSLGCKVANAASCPEKDKIEFLVSGHERRCYNCPEKSKITNQHVLWSKAALPQSTTH